LGYLFSQEYPEDPYSCFLLSGSGFFSNLPLSVWQAPPGATWQHGRRYVAGLDWAQSDDFTVCSVLDATLCQQVALLRVNRLPWSDMRRQIRDLCAHWRVSVLYAEGNSMGTTNIEALIQEFALSGVETHVETFMTTAVSKQVMLGDLKAALQEGQLRLLNQADQRHEFEAFQAVQSSAGHWSYAAPRGTHDDTVIANMAAWGGVIGTLDRTMKLAPAPAMLTDYRG